MRRSRGRVRVVGALAAAVPLTAAAVVVTALPASAATKLSRAQQRLHSLDRQLDTQDNILDRDQQNEQNAKAALSADNVALTNERATFSSLHQTVAGTIANEYKNGSGGSSAITSMLSAKNPSAYLNQISVVTQLTNNRSQALSQYVQSYEQIERDQALLQQGQQYLDQQTTAARQQKKHIQGLVSRQQALINKLSPPATGPTTEPTYNGPATGSARAAVEYAYSKLGDPYVYGAAGPSSFDCSGLTMMAWRAGGVSLAHYVPDQFSETESRKVSRADIQAGDLVFFNSFGHVGIAISNTQFINAPQTGQDVEIDSLNNSYWSANFDAATRP